MDLMILLGPEGHGSWCVDFFFFYFVQNEGVLFFLFFLNIKALAFLKRLYVIRFTAYWDKNLRNEFLFR